MGENFNLQTTWHQTSETIENNPGEVKKEPFLEASVSVKTEHNQSQGPRGGRAPVYHTVGHSIFHENNLEEENATEEEFHAASGSEFKADNGFENLATKPLKNRKTWRRVDAVEDLVLKIGDIFQCKHCGKTGKTSSQVRMHAESHIVGLLFDCHLCGKSFKYRNSLACHKYRVHNPKPKKPKCPPAATPLNLN